jgi:hypothetical protein
VKPNNKKPPITIEKNDPETSLVGQCFHSINNGTIEWQGMVIGNPEPGWYLVQLYEWLQGAPNVQRLVRFESMQDWFFYDDHEQLIYSYEHGTAKHFTARQKAQKKSEAEYYKRRHDEWEKIAQALGDSDPELSGFGYYADLIEAHAEEIKNIIHRRPE